MSRVMLLTATCAVCIAPWCLGHALFRLLVPPVAHVLAVSDCVVHHRFAPMHRVSDGLGGFRAGSAGNPSNCILCPLGNRRLLEPCGWMPCILD